LAVLNRRNRLVNFRLSEQELESLKQVCHTHGARSISDFARGAVLRSMEVAEPGADGPQHKVQHLDQKVAELENRMGLLLQLLQVREQVPASGERLNFAQTA
jgi:hypothetical protein